MRQATDDELRARYFHFWDEGEAHAKYLQETATGRYATIWEYQYNGRRRFTVHSLHPSDGSAVILIVDTEEQAQRAVEHAQRMGRHATYRSAANRYNPSMVNQFRVDVKGCS